ncbi:unnamed protein product [Adineta steineri]|uniref:F-box domain-containing protein n=1 Tax=Adineta steineri TaxID=433720 RepID=A0A819KHJ6_9BILA|nr:unnamed protein product [Adineta steineri]CAF3949478.1 unnamed protein product [Adineta steineri]
MNQPHIHLLDLPDEILLAILKKLSNIDILYSFLNIGNNRLDTLLRDQTLTNNIDLTSIDDITILNKVLLCILPRIHHNVQDLTFQSSLINRVFHAGTYPKLAHLKIKDSSIAAYPGVLLSDLRSTIFYSSTLTELSIYVHTFNDCLYLLDGRLSQLKSFTVRVYDVDAPLWITHNQNNLLRLKYFSLTCRNDTYTYDNRIIPLLHRMPNLEQLLLCLTVIRHNGLIDGTHLKNEILIYMPLLNNFACDIRTWKINNGSLPTLSNDDIQQTFSNIRYGPMIGSIRYFLTNSYLCHVFTLPFTFDYLQCLTNNLPNVLFDRVYYLSIFDKLSFEHEFFIRLSHAFPSLKRLTVMNTTAPQNNNQSYSLIEFKNLNYLNVMNSDISYTEQFLLDTRTNLPSLTELDANYGHLKTVTEDFTRDATRLNCSKIKKLYTEGTLMYSNDYFPLLSN